MRHIWLLVVLTGCLVLSGCTEAVQQARDAHKRKQVERNLRQLRLAVENFERSTVRQVAPSNLRVVSWNVESDGNDPAVIAKQLVELGRYDVFALQEVKAQNFGRYGDAIRKGISKGYRYFGSTTGRSDRLMIIFDSDRLQLAEMREMFAYDGILLNDWRHRSPLVAKFRDKENGAEFLFVTVHLARGNDDLRTQQATGLREWARAQRLPVVAIGDFNMDFDFATGKGNEAFDAMLEGYVWRWVKPEPLVDTNWSDNGNGGDNYPDSMLDFAFVAGTARDWEAEGNVIVRPGDFPDDERTADHRPLELIVED